MERRRFLGHGLATGTLASCTGLLPAVLKAQTAPASVTRDASRALLPSGVQSGDVLANSAIVWTRASRDARMWLEWSTTAGFAQSTRLRGPDLLSSSDGTGRIELQGLPAGQDIFYRVVLEDLASANVRSPAVSGHFRTPLAAHQPATRPFRLVWSGDTAGQGFGINEAFGGMRIYESMRQTNPDVFLHSGDTIYADGPIPAEIKLRDGSLWQNIVTPEVSKVAETLNEFRGRHRYNLMDTHVRALGSEVAQIWQWDDHEVTNNYSDSKDLSANTAYTEKNIQLLAARGQRAFMEYAPMRTFGAAEHQRIYRVLPQGSLADIFVLDMRSYRGPNSHNLQTSESAATDFLGRPQLEWLIAGLKQSRATWKLIAADMPIGLFVPDGKDPEGRSLWEAVANGDHGVPKGRELEMARLLKGIKDAGIKNVVWLTADVHYTAAHHYSPERAQFQDFEPFWEFVSGPLNAGGFGPNEADKTFGLEVVYSKAAPHQNSAPSEGYQFFGQLDIDHRSQALTVVLKDLNGAALYTKTLQPQRA
ncbi:alkaline phosphatase D family protein [Comamonas guangdongensis]|uniref:Alkaline phosphatase n=1 Tax=Comamonas guangdongensis TaxID=510515 RepID=A0ABV3ZQJ7_9BURK